MILVTSPNIKSGSRTILIVLGASMVFLTTVAGGAPVTPTGAGTQVDTVPTTLLTSICAGELVIRPSSSSRTSTSVRGRRVGVVTSEE